MKIKKGDQLIYLKVINKITMSKAKAKKMEQHVVL